MSGQRTRARGRPLLGALTRDLRVEGREGEHEDGGYALKEKLPREPGARHVRYAAGCRRARGYARPRPAGCNGKPRPRPAPAPAPPRLL